METKSLTVGDVREPVTEFMLSALADQGGRGLWVLMPQTLSYFFFGRFASDKLKTQYLIRKWQKHPHSVILNQHLCPTQKKPFQRECLYCRLSLKVYLSLKEREKRPMNNIHVHSIVLTRSINNKSCMITQFMVLLRHLPVFSLFYAHYYKLRVSFCSLRSRFCL